MSATAALEKLIAVPVRHGVVTIDGAILHYIHAGSGPDLVLVHGINMGWGQWYPNIAALAGHYTVYAVDLPGSGESGPADPYGGDFPDALVRALEGFITATHLDRPALIGHSVGGWVAARVALRDNIATGPLVLVSPLGFTAKTPAKYRLLGFKPLAGLLAKTVMRPSARTMHEFATSVLHRRESLDPAFSDYYHDTLRSHGHAHPFAWINRFSGPVHIRKDFTFTDEEIRRLSPRTLIILGRHDAIIPPRSENLKAFAAIPRSCAVVFEGSGHVAATEEADAFNEMVLQFLKASGAPPS